MLLAMSYKVTVNNSDNNSQHETHLHINNNHQWDKVFNNRIFIPSQTEINMSSRLKMAEIDKLKSNSTVLYKRPDSGFTGSHYFAAACLP